MSNRFDKFLKLQKITAKVAKALRKDRKGLKNIALTLRASRFLSALCGYLVLIFLRYLNQEFK
jgi:hypothetical protein